MDKKLEEIIEYIENSENKTKIAKELGISRSKLYRLMKEKEKEKQKNHGFNLEKDIPEEEKSIEEIKEHRSTEFKKKKSYGDFIKLIKINLDTDRPFGICFHGDTHLDNPGADIDSCYYNRDLINKTDGAYQIHVGDASDNWPTSGRLAKLSQKQTITATESMKLIEDWISGSKKMLAISGGNHEQMKDVDWLGMICKKYNILYITDEVRLKLKIKDSLSWKITVRHKFPGTSMWHKVHGQKRYTIMGIRDHLVVGGHIHTSDLGVFIDPETGRICQQIQVGSYKIFDDYKRQEFPLSRQISPIAFAVFNKNLPDTNGDAIKVFWNLKEGIEYLNFLRNKSVFIS